MWSLLLGMEHFTVNHLFSNVTCSGCFLHSSFMENDYSLSLESYSSVGPEVSLKSFSKGGFTFCLSVLFSANAELYSNVILNLIPRSDLPKWPFRHPHVFPSRGLELRQKVNVISGYSILVISIDSHSCSYELWSSILLQPNWHLMSKMEIGWLLLFVCLGKHFAVGLTT